MIKNIIFDIGGVLISYKFEEMMIDAGFSKEVALKAGQTLFNDGMWAELDRGLIAYEEVKKYYLDKYSEDRESIKYLLDHPEKMHVLRPVVYECIKKLKDKGYKLYILSNYSKTLVDIHTENADFWKYMDGGIISYQTNTLKPDADIYLSLINKYDLVPSESLFFDDREENVAGAKKVGMKSILTNSEEHLVGELNKLIR